MPVMFSSTWIDGKINNIDGFLSRNRDRNFFFVLDTNFVIYAREYVQNKDTFAEDYPDICCDFIETLETIIKLNGILVYQFACEEASRSKKTGKISKKKYKLMVYCISKLFGYRFNDSIRSKNPPINENITETKVPLLKCNGLFSNHSAITYAAILKAYTMKNFNKTQDDKEKILSYLEFLDQELNIYSPVFVSFSIHYFGKELNILKNAKPKIGFVEVLNKIYAASIDLMMPTEVAQLAEYDSENAAPIFVTFDKGAKLIFDSLSIVKYVNLPKHGSVPAYTFRIFTTSGWNKQDIEKFNVKSTELLNKRQINGSSSDLDYNRIFNLCAKLEKDLLTKMTRISL